MANYDECEHANLDYKVVERFEKRVTKLLKDMGEHGLSIFCGSGCSIRFNDGQDRDLIVGDFSGMNADGG